MKNEAVIRIVVEDTRKGKPRGTPNEARAKSLELRARDLDVKQENLQYKRDALALKERTQAKAERMAAYKNYMRMEQNIAYDRRTDAMLAAKEASLDIARMRTQKDYAKIDAYERRTALMQERTDLMRERADKIGKMSMKAKIAATGGFVLAGGSKVSELVSNSADFRGANHKSEQIDKATNLAKSLGGVGLVAMINPFLAAGAVGITALNIAIEARNLSREYAYKNAQAQYYANRLVENTTGRSRT